MQKCPLCDRKTRAGDRSCSSCGWDLSDHELTPLQIARVQEEIQDAKDGTMALSIGGIAFVMIALAHGMLLWFTMADVIPERVGFLSPMGFSLFFIYLGLACISFVYRFSKKQDRLRAMLRDKPSFQK
jgi:hypothetical protein